MVMALPLTLALDPRNGLTTYPILIAMILLAIVPILVNAAAGVRDIDPELVEAARGMGLREGEILRQVELPLALPVIVGGDPDLGRAGRRDRRARARSSATAGSGGTSSTASPGASTTGCWAGVVLIALLSHRDRAGPRVPRAAARPRPASAWRWVRAPGGRAPA